MPSIAKHLFVFKSAPAVCTVWAGLCLSALVSCNRPINESLPVQPERSSLVHVYNLAGHMNRELLDLFTTRTGIRVVYEEYDSLDRLPFDLQREPARWDVVITRDYTVSLLRELRLLAPLNLSELPAMKNIEWRFLDLPFDPGSRYSVPYLWGLTVLAYRKDRIDPPPTGWELLWDPAHAGRLMMLDNRREAFGLALLYLGAPLDSRDEGQLAEAGRALLKQADLLAGYDSSARLAEALVQGEIDAAPLFNGDAVNAAARQAAVGYLLPAQGAPRWMDQFVIPRDAAHPAAAHAFINFFCDPEVAVRNADFLKSATPNKAAEPQLDAAIRSDPAVYPGAALLAQCRFYPPFDASLLRLMNSTWTELQASRHPELPEEAGDLPPTP